MLQGIDLGRKRMAKNVSRRLTESMIRIEITYDGNPTAEA